MLFETRDGISLHGRLAGCGKDLIIYAPGAASNITDAEKWVEPLEDIYGYSTFSYDLRGFGRSEGSKFDFENQVDDINDVINTAIERMKKYRRKPKHVILVGHSLGALASLSAGIHHPDIDMVFAISPLYSIEDFLCDDEEIPKDNSFAALGKRILDKFKDALTAPWWFKKFISFMSSVSGNKVDFMPKSHLTRKLMQKVYLVHGLKDEYIPYEKSTKLIIDRFQLTKDRYLLVEAGHSFDNKVDEVLEWIDSKVSDSKSFNLGFF
jgi:pimeloyl-ACP methyl ester carboxylesterase